VKKESGQSLEFDKKIGSDYKEAKGFKKRGGKNRPEVPKVVQEASNDSY